MADNHVSRLYKDLLGMGGQRQRQQQSSVLISNCQRGRHRRGTDGRGFLYGSVLGERRVQRGQLDTIYRQDHDD